MRKIFLAVFLLSSIFLSAQGKLNKAKSGLDKNYKTLDDYKESEASADSSDDGDTVSTFANAALLEAFVQLFMFVGQNVLIGEAQQTDLNLYPYYQQNAGEYMALPPAKNDSLAPPKEYNYKLSDLKANLNYFAGGSVNGVQAKVDFRMFYMLGIEGSYNYFYEDVMSETVNLDVASLMLNYYRVRTKYVTGWWGMGASYVGSGVDTFGFAYNLGFDIFPVDPFSFRLLWKQSFIASDSVNEFQLQGKYHFKRTSLYTGWHYNNIGGVNMGGFAVGLEYILN